MAKARKRSLAEDRRQLEHLKLAFGADTPLSQITAAKVSVPPWTGQPLERMAFSTLNDVSVQANHPSTC